MALLPIAECCSSGVVGFLNWLLPYVFLILPWELFIVLPWVLAVLAERALQGKGPFEMSHLVLFITLFSAVYGAGGHALGLIQAVDTYLGGEGICVAMPPPVHPCTGLLCTPYTGGPQHHIAPAPVSHHTCTVARTTRLAHGARYLALAGWCFWMATHILLAVATGLLFVGLFAIDYQLGQRMRCMCLSLPSTDSEVVFYARCALWFLLIGATQATPYLAQAIRYPTDFGSMLISPGLYSKRAFTPGFTEFLCPVSWLAAGVYFLCKASASLEEEDEEPAAPAAFAALEPAAPPESVRKPRRGLFAHLFSCGLSRRPKPEGKKKSGPLSLF